MHVEFLVEDKSGEVLLEALLPRLLPAAVSWRIHHYKGIGHLPKDLKVKQDPAKRALLNQLPRLLKGYANTPGIDRVFVILDADGRDPSQFLGELQASAKNLMSDCASFHLAVEELEAWLLGDREALMSAYPKARTLVLDQYEQDSVCGTWELLADAIFPGGSKALSARGYPEIGIVKSEWCERIGQKMDPQQNKSATFQAFANHLAGLGQPLSS